MSDPVMNALAQPAAPIPQTAAVPLLRTLVLCDLVDSTALVERLGDQRAADLIRKHDRLARTLLQAHGGREIDKTDGFLILFERPIQAVAFALDYQRGLEQLSAQEGAPLVARVGVHVGDIVTWDNSPDDVAKGAKVTEVEGLVKPIASRLAQLALPGQILLSGVAYSLAHRAQGELGDKLAGVRWRTHGRYRFKGIPDAIPVFEVGEEGRAPLKAPPWSGKAHREVPFWRRPVTLGIELLALGALVAIPAWYLLKPAPAIAFANRDWVVVGDLKNLTGQTGFDGGLQAAFRIGLEQSRYVNVMSDLKTRETIKLMQRDPDKTSIDRAVGSEIALRDGARALILPSVAEIGGRVRVTAEVIDPATQTTVYSESADGVGENSVLPSLDKVNQQLRVRLGEALATVSSESKPLDKAATKNLEALRAYSLGRRAYNSGNMKEALALMQQAVKLDPDFAVARMVLAGIYYNVGENSQALKEIDRAMSTRERLSPRDALYVEAWKAQFGPPLQSIEKWKTLAKLYPDFPFGAGMLGYISWQQANRYPEAIQSVKDSMSSRAPSQGWHEAILAILYLGSEQYDEAERRFAAAKQLGLDVTESHAAAYASRRRFEKIDGYLVRPKGTDVSGQDVTSQNARISFAADQGRWGDVWTLLGKEKAALPPEKTRSLRKMDAIEMSLRAVASTDANSAELQKFIKGEQAALEKEMYVDRSETLFHVLFAAYIAASKGDTKLASSAIQNIGPEATGGEYPVLSRMLAAAQAEIARASGRPDEAIRILRDLPLDGSELCITHVALMDAYTAKGDMKAALEQARWLASHRGRAYTEYNADWIARPFNVVQSDLAQLRIAELSLELDEKDQARTAMTAFRQAWPDAKETAFLSPRLAKLEKRFN